MTRQSDKKKKQKNTKRAYSLERMGGTARFHEDRGSETLL